MNYLDYLTSNERAFPDRVAVRESGAAWTYEELLDDARSAANVLGEAGVDDGDAVVVMLPNTYHFVTATLGALARRAVVVPVNTRFKRREVPSLTDQVARSAAIA